MDERKVREQVRAGYSEAAVRGVAPGMGGTRIGYSETDLASPAAAGNLGLGCGNPAALAALQPGEVVVDLGSGAGFDGLLAAETLGPEGRFIGIDMTPEMLARARRNAVGAGHERTLEFREGLIEALPIVSESVDVVISNCVINLSPDKGAAFREAYRVLRPGGRLAVSDIVLSEPLPEAVRQSVAALVTCIAGAEAEAVYLGYMRDAGFVDITFDRVPAEGLFDFETEEPMLRAALDELGRERARALASQVYSYAIRARRPE